jgi:hypothetical protein
METKIAGVFDRDVLDIAGRHYAEDRNARLDSLASGNTNMRYNF